MQRSSNTSNEVPEAGRVPDTEWREHEHVNETARAAAERLLESAGTPEQAKHVIDVVQESSPDDPTRHYELARHAGFTSYLELVSASTRVGEDSWFVVPLPSGEWMAWNESSLEAAEWESRSAAEAWIDHAAERS